MHRNHHAVENNRPPPSGCMPRTGGAFVLPDGVRFVIICPRAQRMDLLLFQTADAATPDRVVPLTAESHRFGDLWVIELADARADHFYAWRIDEEPGWVLDPYAIAVSRPGGRDDFDPRSAPPEHPRTGESAPKAAVAAPPFDWGDDRLPRIPLSETIYYEANVRGMTRHASAGAEHPGTFQALAERLPYLRELGITTIELMPIHEFNPHEYYMDGDPGRSHLRNFWGYSTLGFFAPHGGYAVSDRGDQVNEFKAFVKAAHAEGLEVLLDVVYNHTAEGGGGGPELSFKCLDEDRFYLLDHEGRHTNYTGCGNTVNANHPEAMRFILESLRYWVTEYHVDGFRFDLATCLARGQDGHIMKRPPLIQAIDEDPVLSGIKLVAEAWDAAGGYQVVGFPGKHWALWNGRYRDDVRRFWTGESGMLPDLVNRLLGSPDFYKAAGFPATRSVNFITCHDGFTLADLTAYTRKHNLANGEENRDGENHNHGVNFGVEGETNDPKILALRLRQQKNLLATLFLSQGTPMLLAGDEFARTQKGNNNAYCQDNEIGWVDWSFAERHTELLEFTRALIRFRQNHPQLRCRRFLDDWNAASPSGREPDIQWFGPTDLGLDWRQGRSIGWFLAASANSEEPSCEESLFIVLNANRETRTYPLPFPKQHAWKLVLHTCAEAEVQWKKNEVVIPELSVVVFRARP